MKTSSKDAISGKFHQVSGKIKSKAGSIIGNPDLVDEGKEEQMKGVIEEKTGQIKKVFGK
jgi:uncharacterized protein YjbJ (UPF0337 family)